MDLFIFVFLSGIFAGLLISGLLPCAFYLFTRKRGQRTANDDVEMRENEEVPLSSSIPSIVEVSALFWLYSILTQYHFFLFRAQPR